MCFVMEGRMSIPLKVATFMPGKEKYLDSTWFDDFHIADNY